MSLQITTTHKEGVNCVRYNQSFKQVVTGSDSSVCLISWLIFKMTQYLKFQVSSIVKRDKMSYLSGFGWYLQLFNNTGKKTRY